MDIRSNARGMGKGGDKFKFKTGVQDRPANIFNKH